MDDYAQLVERIGAMSARIRSADPDTALLVEIEDLLSEGYAVALSGEARMVRLEERLDEILDAGDDTRASELRIVVRRYRAIEAAVARLRRALAGMHAEFVALGGARLNAG